MNDSVLCKPKSVSIGVLSRAVLDWQALED
jgi:hypothetical protein